MKVCSLWLALCSQYILVNCGDVFKRAGTDGLVYVSLQEGKFDTIGSIEVGSNNQTMRVQFSASTTDSVLVAKDANCFEDGDEPQASPSSLQEYLSGACREQGTFDIDSSDSWEEIDEDNQKNVTYGADDLTIGGVTVKEFEFGVTRSTDEWQGIVGIGFTDGNSSVGSLPQQMKSQGLIDRALYSLNYNKTGTSILFGGIDKEQFTGNLSVFDSIGEGEYKNSLVVPIDEITIGENKVTFSNGKAVISNTADYTYIPDPQLSSLAKAANLKYDNGTRSYYTSCKKTKGISFDFTLGDVTIKVPLEDFFDASTSDGQCYLSLHSSYFYTPYRVADDSVTLGSSFLKNAYVVVDLEDRQIGLAPSVDSNKQDLQAVSGPIPEDSGVDESSGSTKAVSLLALTLSFICIISI